METITYTRWVLEEAVVGSTANKYTIVAKLATGGMAEIFLARNESSAGVERYVVLKRVLEHRAADIKFVNMFLDEARLAARLQHPNIAQVYDTGKLGDSYFFTMEYVHGETVRHILHETFATQQPVPLACVLTIIAGVAAGLQHAHDRVGFDGRPLGIVHRDVSPSNLMVSYDGNVKVVDFGVAKAEHRASQTQTGAIKGKVGYMSPEQIRNTGLDARSDLFSLGIVVWEMLIGDRLFARAGEFETLEAIVTAPAPPPSTRRSEVTPEIDAIVGRLLQKSPRDRYQTAEELLEDLEVATVKSGLSLSVPSVRRFMRDLFGVRPEPWLVLARDRDADVVTVTGERYADPQDPGTVSTQLEHLRDPSHGAMRPATAAESPTVTVAITARRESANTVATSVTSLTVADAVHEPTPLSPIAQLSALPSVAVPTPTRTPTVPPAPPPTRHGSAPMPVTVSAMPEPAPDILSPASRWLPARRYLVGGALLLCGVLVFALARPDGSAGTRDTAPAPAGSPVEPQEAMAPPSPPPARADASATTEPAPTPTQPAAATTPSPSPKQPADRKGAVPAPSRPIATTRPKSHAPTRPPSVEAKAQPTTLVNRAEPTDDRKPEVNAVEVAKPDAERGPSKTERESKTRPGCSGSDPLACRR